MQTIMDKSELCVHGCGSFMLSYVASLGSAAAFDDGEPIININEGGIIRG